jgi:hypothetical protein
MPFADKFAEIQVPELGFLRPAAAIPIGKWEWYLRSQQT